MRADKRSVTSSGIYVGYCLGNFVGPLLFKEEDAPDYTPGFIAAFITALVAGVLILVMPRLLNYIVAIYLIVVGLTGLMGTFGS